MKRAYRIKKMGNEFYINKRISILGLFSFWTPVMNRMSYCGDRYSGLPTYGFDTLEEAEKRVKSLLTDDTFIKYYDT